MIFSHPTCAEMTYHLISPGRLVLSVSWILQRNYRGSISPFNFVFSFKT